MKAHRYRAMTTTARTPNASTPSTTSRHISEALTDTLPLLRGSACRVRNVGCQVKCRAGPKTPYKSDGSKHTRHGLSGQCRVPVKCRVSGQMSGVFLRYPHGSRVASAADVTLTDGRERLSVEAMAGSKTGIVRVGSRPRELRRHVCNHPPLRESVMGYAVVNR